MAGCPNHNDQELLGMLREGSHDAFTEIYQRYWESLYQSAYAMLKDADDCTDLVQDLFVWRWQHREKHLTDALKPYLHAAVRYKVANLIRHGKIKETYYAETLASYQESQSDENSMEVKELREIIAQFTQTLPTRARRQQKLNDIMYITL